VVSILIAIGAVLVLDQELLWAIPTAAAIGMCTTLIPELGLS